MNGKNKNNSHYRDCEAITDNLSRIKNKKGVMPILPTGKIQGIFELNKIIGRSLEFFRISRKNRDDSSFSMPVSLVEQRHSKAKPKNPVFSGSFTTTLACLFRMTMIKKSAIVHILALIAVLSAGMISESWAYTKYVYDDYGNIAIQYDCTNANNCTPSYGYDITYDENGNKTSSKYCGSSNIDSNGNCTGYSSVNDYTYDPNTGNQTSIKWCSSFDSSGNCIAYFQRADYTYNANGKIERYCNSSQMDGSGNCTAYYERRDYTYDANGRETSYKDCLTSDSSGNCTWYSYANTSTYDGNVKQTKVCSSHSLIDGSGNCTAYNFVSYTIYDADGNIISSRYCNDSSLIDSSGNCTAYSGGSDFTNDAKGNQTSSKTCNISKGFNSDGSCKEYSSETYYEYTDEYLACTNRINGKCETCGGGYYKKAGTCVSPTTGCGDGYTADSETMQCVKNSTEEPSPNEPVVEDPQESDDPQVSGSASSAAECVASGKYWQEGACVSSCGASFRLNDGWCDRQRYTPAEAAAVLHDDNTNSVTITFKK